MITERKPTAKRRKPAPTALERARDAKPFDSLLYLMELGNALPDDEVARMPVLIGKKKPKREMIGII